MTGSLGNPSCTYVEYPVDVLHYLRLRESLEAGLRGHPPPFRRQSPQLESCRRHLVDWTCQVGERLELASCSVHLAVRLLDLFMDAHVVEPAQLYLVCLVSLLLAAKMEEKDSQVESGFLYAVELQHRFARFPARHL